MPKPSKGGKPKVTKQIATSAKPGAAMRATKLQRDNGKTKRGK